MPLVEPLRIPNRAPLLGGVLFNYLVHLVFPAGWCSKMFVWQCALLRSLKAIPMAVWSWPLSIFSIQSVYLQASSDTKLNLASVTSPN